MSTDPKPTRGFVYTFYSYKGGVGRSMALANVAALLARWGQKVLVIDWDLEAPGIERYFESWLRGPGRKETRGLVDLVEAFAQGEPVSWTDALLRARFPTGDEVHILSAGRDSDDYTARLQKIAWEPLFAEKKFGFYLEKLREEWVLSYDFILIDSRTGITDIGGICTIHLPDVVLPLFISNAQSLIGVRDVMRRARRAHFELPLDRDRLLVVPIPARDESNSEYQTAKTWRETFALELGEFFRDWAPKDEKPYDILDRLKIPYFPYWSFGERLPVMEEDPENPKSLAFSYQLIARLLFAKLDWNEAKQGTAASEAAAAQNAKAAELSLEAARRRSEAHRDAAEREASALNERRQRYMVRFSDEVSRLKQIAEALASRNWSLMFGTCGALATAIGCGVAWTIYNIVLSRAGTVLISFGGIFSACVAILSLFFWMRYTQQRKISLAIINVLNRELVLFEGSAGPYLGLEPGAALEKFVLIGESIIAEGETTRFVDDLNMFAKALHGAAAARPLPVPEAAADSVQGERPSVESLAIEQSSFSTSGAKSPESYDIFVSYRSNQVTTSWLKEFLPLLASWLASLLGDTPGIFVSSELAPGLEFPTQIAHALASARCLLVILTPAYAKSSFCMHELETFARRLDSAIVPVLVQKTEPLPELLRSRQYRDFRDYYFVGGGFTESAIYVDFQKQVRSLAEEIATMVAR
jgi:hypothetical protein